MTRIVAVDPSLRSTGMAQVFNGALVTDVIRPTPLPKNRTPRGVEEQADRVLELVDMVWLWVAQADVLVIEDSSKRSIGGLQEERHWLRGGIVTRARRNGIAIVMLPPKVVKVYATNNGNADKEDMVAAAFKHFPDVDIEDDNAADAAWMAALVARRLGLTIDNVPVEHERAFKSIKVWPELGRAA